MNISTENSKLYSLRPLYLYAMVRLYYENVQNTKIVLNFEKNVILTCFYLSLIALLFQNKPFE